MLNFLTPSFLHYPTKKNCTKSESQLIPVAIAPGSGSIVKNYSINKKEKKFKPNKKGKAFIHSPTHKLANLNYSSREIKIDRDISASIVLSYCHK